MKRLLLYLLFLFPIISEAQTSVYHPFPEDSAKWCASICGNQGNNYNDMTDELQGKVLINGNWYSRMLHYERSCIGLSMCFCASMTGEATDTLYIRQDISQKKVWIYNAPTNSDKIFLDFDLHVGDTINASKAYWARLYGMSLIVSSIDSVLIGTQYRTRFNYNDQGFPNKMIEGIGPDHGFLYPSNHGYDEWPALGQFLQNNHIYYPNYSPTPVDMNQYCHDFATGIEEQNQISFSISPNPAHNQITVSFNGLLKIYDMMGREVQTEYLTPSPSPNGEGSTVSLTCAPGVYFVKVSSGNQTAVQKLIVE